MNTNVDLNRIIDFIKIVDLGNITRAAEAAGTGKAKLSRSLGLLEKELGVQLVYRTTRQFQLTASGVELYKKGKQQMAALQDTIMSLKNQDTDSIRHIRLTAPEDIGLSMITSLVNEFKKMNPQVSFDLIYTNQVLDLVKMGIDVAIRMGDLKDSTLIQKKIGKMEFIAVASPKYLSWSQSINKPEDILNHQMIGFSSDKEIQWKFNSLQEKKSIKIKPKMTANNYLVIKDLVLQGYGIAYMPRYLCDSFLVKGELTHVLKNWRNEGALIQVAMPQQKNVSKTLRSFFDFSVARIAQVV